MFVVIETILCILYLNVHFSVKLTNKHLWARKFLSIFMHMYKMYEFFNLTLRQLTFLNILNFVLSKHLHQLYTHPYMCMYICIYVCVCVCVCKCLTFILFNKVFVVFFRKCYFTLNSHKMFQFTSSFTPSFHVWLHCIFAGKRCQYKHAKYYYYYYKFLHTPAPNFKIDGSSGWLKCKEATQPQLCSFPFFLLFSLFSSFWI